MKKSSKLLILIGFITITVVVSSLLGIVKPIDKNIGTQELTNYKNINGKIANLDNVYKENNNFILPIIFDNPEQEITVNTIKSEFKDAGLTVKNITNINSTTNTIGTGTKITVNENSKEYNVIIYGDVDGDGKVSLLDAQKIIRYVLGLDTTLGDYYETTAANLENSDDYIDLVDAQRIINFVCENEQPKFVSNEPLSLKENDTEAPIITLQGENPVTIMVGSTYIDAGATAEDEVDGDVTKNIQVNSNVDTSNAGTYTVTYTVKDNAGNTANFMRTVKVVDKLSTISITSSTNSAYIYDTVSATVQSGENEQTINIDDLNIKIEKIEVDKSRTIITDESIAKVEKSSDENGNITVKFTANKAGKYRITASVGNDISDNFEIEINENTSVNYINVVTTDLTCEVGKVKNIELEFKHKYANGFSKTVDVKKSDITVSTDDAVNVYLMNANGTGATRNDEIIKSISVIVPKTANVESATIYISVGEAETKKVELKVQQTIFSVNGTDGKSGEITGNPIELYLTAPTNTNSVNVVAKDNSIDDPTDNSISYYTLIPITLDGKKINAKEFKNGDGKIKVEAFVKSEFDDNYLVSDDYAITYAAYKEDKTQINMDSEGEVTTDYLGIAVTNANAKIAYIKITYDDRITITLPVTIK